MNFEIITRYFYFLRSVYVRDWQTMARRLNMFRFLSLQIKSYWTLAIPTYLCTFGCFLATAAEIVVAEAVWPKSLKYLLCVP